MPQEIRIVDIKHFPSASPGRLGQTDTYVFYLAGAEQGYVAVPNDAPSEAEVQAAISRQMSVAATLKGKTLTVG